MCNTSKIDYDFNFKFNLHKSPFSQEKVQKSFVGSRVLYLDEDRKLFNGILKRIAKNTESY